MGGKVSVRLASSSIIALTTSLLAVAPASAHVKWFCAYDVAGQPRGLENVLCPDFELLVGLALFLLLAGCLLEKTFVGDAIVRSLDRVTGTLHANTELIFRLVCGGFFVSLWVLGGVLLTPELKTTLPFVPWMQLGMAIALVSRRTMPLTAAGIVILYAIALWNYGLFHLLDYPIFLGVAAYLALTSLGKDFFGIRPLDVVRWSAGITLMWASIEKWAYPEWSFPLFIQYPSLSMGFSTEFYMRAAGVVEFALAFGLIWTPLVRRVSAAILVGMFTTAIFEFGKIDAIGHSAIIAVMLAIVADPVRLKYDTRPVVLAPAAFATALVIVLGIYYVLHSSLFGTSLV